MTDSTVTRRRTPAHGFDAGYAQPVTARRGLRSGLLATLVTVLSVPLAVTPLVAPQSAAAAEAGDDLSVAIQRVTPTTLQRDGSITVAGVVTNSGQQTWVDARAYLSVAPRPLVTHDAVRDALSRGLADVGPRYTDPSAVVRLGTLRAGQTRRFSITVASTRLGLAEGDGVHPLGIQVLAARSDKPDAVVAAGGAASLLPARTTRPVRRAPTTVLWPFLLPGYRLADGGYADTRQLAASIAPGGQMRNLLDLALTTPRRGSDALLDPSLLAELKALTEGSSKRAAAVTLRRNASAFLDDLTGLAENYSCSTIGFDRPDAVALSTGPSTKELNGVVEQATDGTLDSFDLDCMRIEWPSGRGVSRTVLTSLRREDVKAAVVSPWAVPGWDASRGSLVARQASGRQASSGSLPLIVDDRLDRSALGIPTSVTLRQSILSDAVLAGLTAGADVATTSTVVVVDPTFNPGRVGGEPLAAVYASDVTDPKNLAARVEAGPPAYLGPIPDQPGAKPISNRLVTVAADAAQTARLLDGVLLDEADRTTHAQVVARLVSQRWRGVASTGLDAADAAIDSLSAELAAISVEGPEALTLSSGKGQFPITVRNQTPHRVRVELGIDASAPGVTFKAPRSVDVSAGESRTVTVDVDLASQTATSVSVRLSSRDGLPFGASTVFNVRSSRVGAALWIAIGVSVAFVAIALLRRFARPSRRPRHAKHDPTDFDD